MVEEARKYENQHDPKLDEDSEYEINLEFDLFESKMNKKEKVEFKNMKRAEDVELSKERYTENCSEMK